MAELLTALGIMLVLGVGAWYLGSLLLRVAAFWCFVGAGVLLLVAGEATSAPGPGRRCSPGARRAGSSVTACSACGGAGGARLSLPGCSPGGCGGAGRRRRSSARRAPFTAALGRAERHPRRATR